MPLRLLPLWSRGSHPPASLVQNAMSAVFGATLRAVRCLVQGGGGRSRRGATQCGAGYGLGGQLRDTQTTLRSDQAVSLARHRALSILHMPGSVLDTWAAGPRSPDAGASAACPQAATDSRKRNVWNNGTVTTEATSDFCSAPSQSQGAIWRDFTKEALDLQDPVGEPLGHTFVIFTAAAALLGLLLAQRPLRSETERLASRLMSFTVRTPFKNTECEVPLRDVEWILPT